jgi:hypothetical protein
MMLIVCWVGSGNGTGTLEKMSKVTDSVLHLWHLRFDRIYP